MTTIEQSPREKQMNRLLSECFVGGEIRRRELRLSHEEAGWVAQAYPATQVRHLDGCWYEISFQEALLHV